MPDLQVITKFLNGVLLFINIVTFSLDQVPSRITCCLTSASGGGEVSRDAGTMVCIFKCSYLLFIALRACSAWMAAVATNSRSVINTFIAAHLLASACGDAHSALLAPERDDSLAPITNRTEDTPLCSLIGCIISPLSQLEAATERAETSGVGLPWCFLTVSAGTSLLFHYESASQRLREISKSPSLPLGHSQWAASGLELHWRRYLPFSTLMKFI